MDIICDIDGTLLNITGRIAWIKEASPPNWERFRSEWWRDTPIQPIVTLMQTLGEHPEHNIIMASGRTEKERPQTELQLHRLDIRYSGLYMRATGDFRPDYIVKEEILIRIKKNGYQPELAFDDRQQVVDMWRRNGIRCAQVDVGNF